MRSRRVAVRGLRENGPGPLLRVVRHATIGCDVAARVRRNRKQDPECRQCSDDETLHGVLLWRRRQGDCVRRKASAVPLARLAMRCPDGANPARRSRHRPGFESMRGRATEQQHAGGVIHRARVTDRVGLLLAGGGTCASERTGKAGRTPRRGAPTVDATLTL
jgi:hypothetical protein